MKIFLSHFSEKCDTFWHTVPMKMFPNVPIKMFLLHYTHVSGSPCSHKNHVSLCSHEKCVVAPMKMPWIGCIVP